MSNLNQAWSVMTGPLEAIGTLRMDLSQRIMNNEQTPIFFSSEKLLDDWVLEMGFTSAPVGSRAPGNAKYVVDKRAYHYTSCWVRAKYTAYRDFLTEALAEALKCNVLDMASVDADHVANRASMKDHSDAWVALVPVPKAVNQAFGSKFERSLHIAAEMDRVDFDPRHAFKLFSDRFPENSYDFEQAMKAIKSWFFVDDEPHGRDFCMRIESEARTVLNL